MDARRFDDLAVLLAGRLGRRAMLAGIAAIVGSAPRPAAAACGEWEDRCIRNTDCCSELKCQGTTSTRAGACVYRENGCRDDRDCGRRQRCVQGRCRDQCRDDRDCRSDEACVGGRCETRQDCRRSGERCRRNGQCCASLICDADRRVCSR